MTHHKFQKILLHIKGMHCRSCELILEKEFSRINGVEKSEANYHKGTAEIYYHHQKPSLHKLQETVVNAGYDIGVKEQEGFISNNAKDYQELFWAVVIVFVGYQVLKLLGFTELNFNPDTKQLNFGVIILIGLTAGFSSCMAMIGGLVLGLSAKHAEKHPEATAKQKFRPHLYFNLGRIGGYALLGGLLGLLGSVFQLSIFVTSLFNLFASIVMLLVGLQLIKIFPWINSWNFTLPKSLLKIIGLEKHHAEYNHKNSMLVGALTFFLPCGFTQAMQIYAVSTGSFFNGAMTMGLFAFGTAFGLLSIGGITSVFKGLAARKFFKIAGVVVIAFAMFNFSNSLNLMGVNFKNDEANTDTKNLNAKNSDEVQVVKITEGRSGYSPRNITIKKGVPVKLIVDAQSPFSCAASFVIPKLGISKNLVAGENIFEFTPDKVGKIPFSCSMGMYTGFFNVVE